jgi:RHS repeat-associated protein
VPQTYGYDSLNRLSSAQENGGASWAQNFSYDRYGNRTFISGTTLPGQLTPSNNPVINAGNNRLNITVSGQTSVTYDPAGNITHDVNGHSYVYDGENKQTTYEGGASANGGATYSYDGDGRRVKKVVGGSPVTSTVFVYNIQGQLVAEYSDAQPTTAGGTSYLTEDTLGTPRVDTDASGNVKARHDYQPFGEELYAGVGSRTAPNGYVGDNINQKFTQKERDNETGLDYFGARYYSSIQGRFTSPDEFAGGPHELFDQTGDSKKQALPYAEIVQPQSLNKYTYVYNNPCRYTDPDGHCGEPSGLKPGQVGICVASYIESTFFPRLAGPGRGDGRGPNGQGGTSRIEARLIVDHGKGTVTKTYDDTAKSSILIKGVGFKGTGETRVSDSPQKDKQGNLYFQINQHADSAFDVKGALGSIDNHLNMVVQSDLKVGVTPSSTARDFPSLEIYKYTIDSKGNHTTTLVLDKRESGNFLDLRKPEKPIKADPK